MTTTTTTATTTTATTTTTTTMTMTTMMMTTTRVGSAGPKVNRKAPSVEDAGARRSVDDDDYDDDDNNDDDNDDDDDDNDACRKRQFKGKIDQGRHQGMKADALRARGRKQGQCRRG